MTWLLPLALAALLVGVLLLALPAVHFRSLGIDAGGFATRQPSPFAKPEIALKVEEERRLAETRRAEARRETEVKKTEEALKADQARRAAEAKAAEEARKAALAKRELEAKKAAEAKAADEAKRAEEARRAEQARKAEEVRRAEEAKRLAQAKAADDARKAEDARRLAQAKEAESARRAEQAKKAEEEKRAAEAAEQTRQAEAKKAAEAKKVAEERKVAEARKAVEEERRRIEERLKAKKDAEAAEIRELRRNVERPATAQPPAQREAGPAEKAPGAPPFDREDFSQRHLRLQLERKRIEEALKFEELKRSDPRSAEIRTYALRAELERLLMEERRIELQLETQKRIELAEAEVRLRRELESREADSKRRMEVEAARSAQAAREDQRRLEEETRKNAYLNRMKQANVAFNHPKEMYVARRTQVSLALAPSEEKAKETLARTFERKVEGELKTGSVRFAPHMIARLHGKDFKIEAAGPEEKMVLGTEPVEWTWYVEALVAGTEKLLRLELLAVLSRPGERLPPLTVRTFEARINVNVRLWDRVIIQAREMQPIAVVLSSLGVLGTAFALFLKFSEWRVRRRAVLARIRDRERNANAPPSSPGQPAVPPREPSDWLGH